MRSNIAVASSRKLLYADLLSLGTRSLALFRWKVDPHKNPGRRKKGADPGVFAWKERDEGAEAVVGKAGFEPATSASRTPRAS